MFTNGNVVVERVGTGAAPLTNSDTTTFLDEYRATTPFQASPLISRQMPTMATGNSLAIKQSGTDVSSGYLSRTVSGHALVVPGYSATTTNVAFSDPAPFNRTIALEGASDLISWKNGFSDGPAAPYRSAVSTDGSAFWVTTQGSASVAGVRFKLNTDSVTSTTPILNGDTRNLTIFRNSLFVSSGDAAPGVGVSLVGTAGTMPTSAVSALLLPGTGTSGSGTPSPYGIALFDNPLNGNNWNLTGADTLYVADDRPAANGGGLQRWSYNGTTWVLTGTSAVGGNGFRGLTGVQNGTSIALWATDAPGTGSNNLFLINDQLSASSGAFGPSVMLATAGPNTTFRGVALSPVPEPSGLALLGLAAGIMGARRLRRRTTPSTC